MGSSNLPWRLSLSTAPVAPRETEPSPGRPVLSPVAPGPKKTGWGFWGLAVLMAVAAGVALWTVRQQALRRPTTAANTIRTAAVRRGDFERKLRVGGTVIAKDYAAIRTPEMRGPRDAGRGAMTLMTLARPGSIVKVGDVVAQFELRAAQDHLDDVKSTVVQKKSDVDKRRAEIMVLEETTRQSERTARGEYDKAQLDLRTAEVRSEIEASLLKLALLEKEATWKQLQQQVQLQQKSDEAQIRSLELDVAKEENHLGRHQRDLERMTIKAPVPGLVVMESMFRGGGQFDQVQAGDQVFPGTLFMQVVDLSQMLVNASTNQVEVQSVRIGQKVQVQLDAYPNLVLEGRIAGIGALAAAGGGRGFWRGSRDAWVRNIEVQILIDTHDERVIPDLSASADILLSHEPDQLLIPRAAIRGEAEDQSAVVYVKQGQQFSKRQVQLGEVSATQAVVLEGLSEGDVVALQDIPTA